MLDSKTVTFRPVANLWALIGDYEFDSDADGKSFAARVEEETGLSKSVTQDAIAEYRRFLYLLAVTDEQRIVPSRIIDEIWHLHLQHTRDYWGRFCPMIGKDLHHVPGGKGRQQRSDYEATLALYREAFGGAAPSRIWPSAQDRVIFYAGLALAVLGGVWLFFSYDILAAVSLVVGIGLMVWKDDRRPGRSQSDGGGCSSCGGD